MDFGQLGVDEMRWHVADGENMGGRCVRLVMVVAAVMAAAAVVVVILMVVVLFDSIVFGTLVLPRRPVVSRVPSIIF